MFNKIYGYIYKTTNIITNKIYIGKSKKINNINYYLGSGVILKKAIKKYGKENFKKEILCYCENYEEINKKEKEYILLFKSYKKNIGYNIAPGGEGGNTYENFTEQRKKEARDKLSKTIKGRKLSEEHKRKIGESNKGKIVPKESREKMSKSGKGKGKGIPKSKEHGKKIGEKNKERYLINKLIDKKTQDEIILLYTTNKYISLSQLSKKFNIGRSTIKRLFKEKNINIKKFSELRKGNKNSQEKRFQTINNWSDEKKKEHKQKLINILKKINKEKTKRLIISPDNIKYLCEGNFNKMCQNLKINRCKMLKVMNGEIDNYKGWQCINLKKNK